MLLACVAAVHQPHALPGGGAPVELRDHLGADVQGQVVGQRPLLLQLLPGRQHGQNSLSLPALVSAFLWLPVLVSFLWLPLLVVELQYMMPPGVCCQLAVYDDSKRLHDALRLKRSLRGIWGEGWTIHSPPALFFKKSGN